MVDILNYVYSVINCSRQMSLGGVGLRGEEVLSVPHENISAVVSRIQTDLLLGNAIEQNEANWLKHDQVVRSLMVDYTVLPVKFGSLLKSDRDLKMMLRRLLPECKTELKRFRDKLEFSVRVLAGEEDLKRAGAREGRDLERFRGELLRTRQAMIRGRSASLGEAVEVQLDMLRRQHTLEIPIERLYYAGKFYNILAGIAVEARSGQPLSPDMVLSIYLLLDKARIETLTAELKAIEALYPGFQFLLSGPWAPYNFTRIKYY